MFSLEKNIKINIKYFISEKYNIQIEEVHMEITNPNIEGDYTILLFPLVKILKKNPKDLGLELGEYLKEQIGFISTYTVIKGFLNIKMSSLYWSYLLWQMGISDYGKSKPKEETIMLEYCSPNTNKPLHVGHLKNMLLGKSLINILEYSGYKIIKTQVVNDRGIAICKSMLMWLKYGDNKPDSIKGDHYVGHFYSMFQKKFQEEYKEWQKNNEKNIDENTYFNLHSELGKEAKEILQKWENGDEETLILWEMMNNWVYEGFNQTFDILNVDFDKVYYESETYALGKKIVKEEDQLFYTKPDGSIWIDLSEQGLDHKLLLRGDGTSVYITQDIGTAIERSKDYSFDKMIYVVGNEQEYHFKVLFEILKKINLSFSEKLHHLSYGMLTLPDGKMSSRDGTVINADNLIEDIIYKVKEILNERNNFNGNDQNKLANIIGLGALKYFILKTSPQKNTVFNLKEVFDFNGNSCPYIQNAFVRIVSILNKNKMLLDLTDVYYAPQEVEINILKHLYDFKNVLNKASELYDPSIIIAYAYELAKMFHNFYHNCPVLNAENKSEKIFRLKLCLVIKNMLYICMNLLDIELPDKM